MNTHHSERSFIRPNSDDVLTRLRLDAGTRTLGELIQERQLAISEILRLQAIVREMEAEPRPTRHIGQSSPATPSPQLDQRDLLTLKESCALLALARSTVYGLMKVGKFPSPLQVTTRSVRWRRIDVERWQSTLRVRGDHGKKTNR